MSRKTIFQRVLVSMLLGMFVGAILSEGSYWLLGAPTRAPHTIDIIIPAGTAALVAQGGQPPSISPNMSFVAGDVLRVVNKDTVDHSLGPLWIPAGTSGQLQLGASGKVTYECSFQPGKYLGLDIRSPLTIATRIYGIVDSGLPLGILIALYVFVPLDKRKTAA